MQRVSAIALVPLTVWFIAAIIAQTGADYTAFVAWMRNPITDILMVLLLPRRAWSAGSCGGLRSLRRQICSRDSGAARLFDVWHRGHSRNASHSRGVLEDSIAVHKQRWLPNSRSPRVSTALLERCFRGRLVIQC